MAVVGHAYVVVRAITDKVEGDIKRAFNGTSVSANKAGRDMGNALMRGIGTSLQRNNSFSRLRDQLRELYPEAERAADSFTKLVRTGFVAQSAVGALAGSLGALVGGLGALIGAAAGAATSLIAVASAAISLRVGIGLISFAFKGISQAVAQATKTNSGYSKSIKQIKFDLEEAALSVTRAELNLERAREGLARVADLAPNNRLRREAELAVREAELALRRAKDAAKNPQDQPGGGGPGVDPFAGLTPSQKEFAKFLTDLQPLFEKLREAAAKGFLPVLQKQIERLIDAGLFDILETRFYDIARAAGAAVEGFTDIFLAGDNLKDFDQALFNIATNLPSLGRTAGNLFDAFLSAINAADPLTKKFIGFIEQKAGALATFLNAKQASGELEVFFNRAGIIAGQFGEIFGNIFGGLGSLIEANFGPGSGGDKLLVWLDKATEGWRNLDLISQQKYFRGAADNFIAMGDAMGGAIETVIKQGSNPAIMDFWNTLDRGSFAFDQIIRGSVEAAPALADFLRVATEIVAIFADSKPVMAFFDTLTFMLRGVQGILTAIKPFLDIAGPIFAMVSAVTLLGSWFTKVTLIFIGFGVKVLGFLAVAIPGFGAKLPAAMLATGNATKGAAAAMTLFNATNPVGWIALAVTAIVGLGTALAGIKGAQVEKAMKGVERGFKSGADAADIWGQATLAVMDGPQKQAIDSIDEMKAGIGQLAKAQKDWTYALPSTTAMADSFGAMGKALSNLAVTDLVAAQTNFKKFKTEVGLSTDEMSVALNEMDEFKTALIDQADAMGISIRTQSGQIDMMKLTEFAMGEGEYAIRMAKQAQDELNAAIDRGAQSFVDYTGPINQNKEDVKQWAIAQAKETKKANDTWKDYWDGQSFSMDKYLDDLEIQVKAAQEWRTNIAKLAGKLPEDVYNKVIEMGEAGAALVAGLTDGVNDEEEQRRLINSFKDTGFAAGNAVKNGLSKALPKGISLRAMMQKDGGFIDIGYAGFNSRGYAYSMGGYVSGAGTARSDSIPAMLSNGEYVVNARATAANRRLLETINSNREVPLAPTIHLTVNPSAQMNEKELAAEVSRQLAFEIRKGGL